jgi:hypothetical protein
VDLVDLNHQGRDWLDLTANVRIHGTTGEVPFDRLPLEQLQPLAGKPDYDTSLITFRRSTKDCFVSYEGNYYSVPFQYARKTLTLKETEDRLLIILSAQDDEIARHRLLDGRNQRVVVPAHYENIGKSSLPAKRPVAVQLLSAEGLPPAPEVEARPLSWYEQLAEAAG